MHYITLFIKICNRKLYNVCPYLCNKRPDDKLVKQILNEEMYLRQTLVAKNTGFDPWFFLYCKVFSHKELLIIK